MSTIGENMWITPSGRPRVVENGDCAPLRAAHMLRSSRRGSQRHQRLHQRSDGGSFGTFRCPANAATVCKPCSSGLEVAPEPADHLGRLLVRAVPWLRGGTRERPELPVAGIAQSGDDV